MTYVKELEGLRGIMAVWVVIGHWATTADIPRVISQTKLYNGTAVDVFVILSGFAIASLMMKREEPYRLYLARRFFRIFPVYLLFLLLSAAVAPLALDIWQGAPVNGYMREPRIEFAQHSLANFWPHLMAHLTGLHGVVPRDLLQHSDYALLGQAWSISLEWQFYLVAPFLFGVLYDLSARRALIALGVIAALVLLGRQTAMPAGYLGGHMHLAKFYLGGLTAVALLNPRFAPLAWSRYGQFAAAAVALIALLRMQNGSIYIGVFIWAAIMFVVIGARRQSDPVSRSVSKMLNSRACQYLGQISYSVYLSHMLAILLGVAVLSAWGLNGGWVSAVLLLLITLPVTYILSINANRLVEKPFHDYGRGLGRPAKPPAMPGVAVASG